jgi:hypothetical protein
MVYATSGVKEDEERKREGPKGMKADSDKWQVLLRSYSLCFE